MAFLKLERVTLHSRPSLKGRTPTGLISKFPFREFQTAASLDNEKSLLIIETRGGIREDTIQGVRTSWGLL